MSSPGDVAEVERRRGQEYAGDDGVDSKREDLLPAVLKNYGTYVAQVFEPRRASPSSGSGRQPPPASASSRCHEFQHVPGLYPFNFTEGCLTQKKWYSLLKFCQTANCELVFGLNNLRGRHRVPAPPPSNAQFVGVWDPRNVFDFLAETVQKYGPTGTVEKNLASEVVRGWELGNELAGTHGIAAHLEAEQSARELVLLGQMIRFLEGGVLVVGLLVTLGRMKWALLPP